MDWWTLPGPRSFINAVIDDIQEGKTVFLCLPDHTPGRLSQYLQEAFEGVFGWISTRVEPGISPIDFLYEYVGPDAAPGRLRNPANLVLEEGFRNKLIWLDDIPQQDWEQWAGFFEEYERISRSVPDSRRSCFVVRLAGPCALLPLPRGVGLSAQRWDGFLRRHDMLVYSTAHVADRTTGLESDLAAALVSVLGGWDPDLCDHLAGCEIRDLLQPAEILRAFASERGWTFSSPSLDQEKWSKGLWQTYNGSPTPHTCFSVVLNGSRHLDYLIWQAEIGVLMPYIEQQRQKLIEQHRPLLKMPYQTTSGVIEDIYDLEIGIIEWILVGAGATITNGELQFVSSLKHARNKLSHLTPVDPDRLLSLCRHAQRDKY
jgi:hypothetical protein